MGDGLAVQNKGEESGRRLSSMKKKTVASVNPSDRHTPSRENKLDWTSLVHPLVEDIGVTGNHVVEEPEFVPEDVLEGIRTYIERLKAGKTGAFIVDESSKLNVIIKVGQEFENFTPERKKVFISYLMTNLNEKLETKPNGIETKPNEIEVKEVRVRSGKACITFMMQSELVDQFIEMLEKDKSFMGFKYEYMQTIRIDTKTIIQKDLIKLQERLVDHFDLNGLRHICSKLEVNYENLEGHGLIGTAEALVNYFKQRKQVFELVEMCKLERPYCSWEFSLHIHEEKYSSGYKETRVCFPV